jgi:hypothetical protein
MKYDSKKMKETNVDNKVHQHVLQMICYKDTDPDQRLKGTVKLFTIYDTGSLNHKVD